MSSIYRPDPPCAFLAICNGEVLTCDELRRRSTSATQMFSITPLSPPSSFPRLDLDESARRSTMDGGGDVALSSAGEKPLTAFSGRKSTEFMQVSTSRVISRCSGGCDHRSQLLARRRSNLHAVKPPRRPSLIPLRAGRFVDVEHVGAAGASRWYLLRRRVDQ